MITSQDNDRLTRVGPGTPCGALMRRYWQPLCGTTELTTESPKKRVRIMGEDLIVFRDGQGNYGCVDEKCKHRGTSLFYGFIEDDGIRCCYHGWRYGRDGRCMEQPFEPAGSKFKDEIRLTAYPVQQLGGLLFVYMGPDPSRAPLLPRWDILVRTDGRRTAHVFPTHECNWLQVQENTADSTHTYYLHGRMYETLAKTRGINNPVAAYYLRPIEKYEFSFCEWGIDKVIYYGGDVPEKEVRPPLLFPNLVRIPAGPLEVLRWRVPIDDVSTRLIGIHFLPASHGGSKEAAPDGSVPVIYEPEMRLHDGEYDLVSFVSQDQMAAETQGRLYDRKNENLGVSDRGLVLYRKMLDEQIARVERGEEPDVAVVRDPAKNRIIEFPSATSPVDGLKKLNELASAGSRT
jgi:5,5'-dehydrodivanillate O-demethylase oxygenase subunit